MECKGRGCLEKKGMSTAKLLPLLIVNDPLQVKLLWDFRVMCSLGFLPTWRFAIFSVHTMDDCWVLWPNFLSGLISVTTPVTSHSSRSFCYPECNSKLGKKKKTLQNSMMIAKLCSLIFLYWLIGSLISLSCGTFVSSVKVELFSQPAVKWNEPAGRRRSGGRLGRKVSGQSVVLGSRLKSTKSRQENQNITDTLSPDVRHNCSILQSS